MIRKPLMTLIGNLGKMSLSVLCMSGYLLLAACGGGGGASTASTLDGTASPALISENTTVASAPAPSAGSLVIAASAPMPTANSGTVGGTGATCNPSTAGWPACTKATILVKQNGYITNTVHIPGGHLSSAYLLNQPNTEYILDGDITADGTAFSVSGVNANYIYLNLNGHSVTYNLVSPGEGVNVTNSNLHDIAVANGSIIQGAAMSEGDQYGKGNNPVFTGYSPSGIPTWKSVGNMQVANLYVRYGGKDVGGLMCYSTNGLYEQNTIEDTYQFGTLKNRHQGVDALKGSGSAITARYNTIVNARHRGISASTDSVIYENYITTRSIATNAYGIMGYAIQNVQVYNNTIIARGEHPIGIGFVSAGTNNIEIYNNLIDSKITALGEEYSSSYLANPTATIEGNEAIGFRTTWGGNNIHFHDNDVTVASDSYYVGTYSPTGATAYIKSNARGLMVSVLPGEYALFENNTITALDEDGTMDAKCIAVNGYDYDYVSGPGTQAGMIFKNNTLASNSVNIALGDSYGASAGWPLFIQNNLVKTGSHANYATFACTYDGYYSGTAKIVASVYSGGASESSLRMNWGQRKASSGRFKSLIFGRLMTATVKNSSGVVQPGVALETHLQSGNVRSVTDTYTGLSIATQLNGQVPMVGNIGNTEVITDANGQAYVIVYDYELHDVGSTSSVPLTVYYQPHAIELGSLLLTPYVTGTSAWDALTSSGTYTYTYNETSGSW